ncbi:hypothetical protein [Thermodesulfobacterium thermophilum]|uniref:hypothetical protein n=1 Tax=Thermodesulfobacterium thermophilum TaxID=886 RepID=UPI0003B7A56E|nr:hypothetical protein [Thermodesulfobacterium thermophilum]
MRKKANKGFALIYVLILSLVLILISTGIFYILQIGYFSINAEAKYQIAEKKANKGLMVVLENGKCTNYQDEGINVKTIKDEGYNLCFVWSEGTFNGARVVKVSLFSLKGSNWAAAMFRKLDNLSGMQGSAAIVGYDSPENSCDDPNSCIAPALMTGNSLSPQNIVQACYINPNNLGSGLISMVEPYKYDPTLNYTDLTSKLFNAENRTALFYDFNEAFQVEFQDGTPVGLKNNNDIIDFSGENLNSCEAKGTTIKCGSINITWNSNDSCYYYNNPSNCKPKINFGQNTNIDFDNFSGGGYILANRMNFKGDIKPAKPIVLVAKNQIVMSTNNIEVANVYMFSQNYLIDSNNLKIENSLIYSGGKGVGNLDINLGSNSQLGTQNSPVLIISDNNINVTRNGNADIWGVIFVTDANNNFNIGSGNGNFKIHGAVISNSLNNNNINISGNFEVRFNFEVLKRLYSLFHNTGFNILKSPSCGEGNIGNLYRLTTIKIY